MPEAFVECGDRPPMTVRINGSDPTFVLDTENIRAKSLSDLSPELLDLLDVAATVFAADGHFRRGGPTRLHMGQDWRRDFRFRIPVRRQDLWSDPEVNEALCDAVSFLTDDNVSFEFFERPSDLQRQPFLRLDPSGPTFGAEDVILFSGGLDSLAGALDILSESSSSRVVLVTHRSAQKMITPQERLGEYLRERFRDRVLPIHVLARRKNDQAKDTTQRSRTLLFAALGQAIAQTFNAARVNFFENGFVSHNLPLSPQIVGTMATRTTHPLSLEKLRTLIGLVTDNPRPMENRYQWLTKADVVRRISERDAADQIGVAVSCTSVREQTSRHHHCGACSQCFDRRFAVLACGLEAHDPAEQYATDILLGERSTTLSKTMAVEWTRHALNFIEMDERSLMERFGLEIGRIARGHPDQSMKDTAMQTLKMHRRHGKTVLKVFEDAVRRHASELARHELAPTSTLSMHLSCAHPDQPSIAVDPTKPRLIEQPLGDVPEYDLDLDPAQQLRVHFLTYEGNLEVSVEGLGRITGADARVPHALHVIFEEDRLAGLIAEKYRFTPPGKMRDLPISNDAIRASIRRTRKLLATNFMTIHGYPPEGHLLIQNKPTKGYRLDPTIEAVNDSR